MMLNLSYEIPLMTKENPKFKVAKHSSHVDGHCVCPALDSKAHPKVGDDVGDKVGLNVGSEVGIGDCVGSGVGPAVGVPLGV